MKDSYGRSQHHRGHHIHGDRQLAGIPGPLFVLHYEGM